MHADTSLEQRKNLQVFHTYLFNRFYISLPLQSGAAFYHYPKGDLSRYGRFRPHISFHLLKIGKNEYKNTDWERTSIFKNCTLFASRFSSTRLTISHPNSNSNCCYIRISAFSRINDTIIEVHLLQTGRVGFALLPRERENDARQHVPLLYRPDDFDHIRVG